ncbi:MAG: CPBP family intramembrane metalloprotease [Candidatus Lokiarchaeota archaeon]|nr:CPBP family intramembrane metalloprotease [Candidatus Lokiarchaeota archaeon]MBD3353964.1 CPBP family intramembrane metalloprotease [Candidatus Lokiarchaeota archaeon]
MSVKKASKVKREYNNQGIHTKVSITLSIIAIGIMGYLGIRHYAGLGFEGDWGRYALAQSLMGLMGLIGTMAIRSDFNFRFRDFNINTGFFAMITLVGAMVTQVLSQYVLTITNTEQALYYVFSSVCEELFFRLFLINLLLMFDQEKKLTTKLIAVLIAAVGFAAFHQNYYGNIGLLVGVFLGGCVFGIAYILTDDITVPILAHFILNIIATGNWLVTL